MGTGAALAVAAEESGGDIEGKARAALCWVTSVCVTLGSALISPTTARAAL